MTMIGKCYTVYGWLWALTRGFRTYLSRIQEDDTHIKQACELPTGDPEKPFGEYWGSLERKGAELGFHTLSDSFLSGLRRSEPQNLAERRRLPADFPITLQANVLLD